MGSFLDPTTDSCSRVARWRIFIPKIPILYTLEGLGVENFGKFYDHLVYVMIIWYIFYYFVYFMIIWYIFDYFVYFMIIWFIL
jgi:hypothetical protein